MGFSTIASSDVTEWKVHDEVIVLTGGGEWQLIDAQGQCWTCSAPKLRVPMPNIQSHSQAAIFDITGEAASTGIFLTGE